MTLYCCAANCLHNNKDDKQLSFFTFPKDSKRWTQWLIAIDRQDLVDKFNNNKRSSYRICSEHFDEDCLIIKKAPTESAIPKLQTESINALEQISRPIIVKVETLSDKTTTSSTQTDPNLNFSTQIDHDIIKKEDNIEEPLASTSKSIQTSQIMPCNTPRKRKSDDQANDLVKKSKIKEGGQNEEITKERFLELTSVYFDSKIDDFIKCQILLQQNYKGKRYPTQFKMFCLNLQYSYPQSYQFLQRFFCLPGIQTLQRLSIPINTDLNTHVLDALKQKVSNMSPMERLSFIGVDSIPVKTNLYYDVSSDRLHGLHEIDGISRLIPAKYALVIMIKGLFNNWKQPVAYALTAECKNCNEITEWIHKTIKILIEIGFDVRGFISDIDSDFINLRDGNVTTSQNYFVIDEKKIYYIFDVPHLLKSVRDNLMNYDFHFDNGRIAKWKHIIKVYNEENPETLRLCPKLTEAHVQPNIIQKNIVKYALQLFSKSLVAAMKTYIKLGIIEEEAHSTVWLIQFFNDLFDLLNSSKVYHENMFKKAYSGDDFQEKFLDKAMSFFETVKLVCAENNDPQQVDEDEPRFIKGFMISIQSIRNILTDLKEDNYSFLLTRKINPDCFENFFGLIRLQSNNTEEPTCIQFVKAFRKIFVMNMMEVIPHKNRKDDLSNILSQIKNYMATKQSLTVEEEFEIDALIMDTQDYVFNLPENNILYHISCYLIRKCAEIHKCETFLKYLSLSNTSSSSTDSFFEQFKKYSSLAQVIIPPIDFIQFIGYMEVQFRTHFTKGQLSGTIGTDIIETIENTYPLPCECFPLMFVKRLFVRMRIHNTLQLNNKRFKLSKQNQEFIQFCNI